MSGRKKNKKPFDPYDESTYPDNDGEPEEGQEPEPPVWPDALEQILLAYKPVPQGGNYTDTYTSEEMITALYSHCGQAPRKAVLMTTLIERGYRYEVKNGMELHWLLQKV